MIFCADCFLLCYRIFSFLLDFIQLGTPPPKKKQVFLFCFLCTLFLSIFQSLHIFHLAITVFLICTYLILFCLMHLALFLWIVSCLSFMKSRISFVIHFFFPCLSFFKMRTLAVFTSSSLKVIHFKSLSGFKTSYLFWTFNMLVCKWSCCGAFPHWSLDIALAFCNFWSLTSSLYVIGN